MPLDRQSLPPLYAITDASASADRTALVASLIEAGVRWIQLREKGLSDLEFFRIAEALESLLPAKVFLFVNDRPDIAIASNADGVHVGDQDLPPAAVKSVSPSLLVGYSTHSLEEALAAAEDEAVDYLAIGPIFRSPTKNVRAALGTQVITAIRARTDKPVVAIGGIDASNIGEVLAAGADSAAVISALYQGGDVAANVRRLLDAVGAVR